MHTGPDLNTHDHPVLSYLSSGFGDVRVVESRRRPVGPSITATGASTRAPIGDAALAASEGTPDVLTRSW